MQLLVFDIGSNSVRTLRVTQDAQSQPHFSGKHVYTTRLAEGLAESGSLSTARMQQSLLVIRSLHGEYAPQGFLSYAYATSAVRDAMNGPDFLRSIEEIIGRGHARILTGEEEAAFAQQGANPDGGRIILDIGGGSTQIVRPGSRESWPIGCVRAKDLAPQADLLSIADALYPILSGCIVLSYPAKSCSRRNRCSASAERSRRSHCSAKERIPLRPGKAKSRSTPSRCAPCSTHLIKWVMRSAPRYRF
jgi:hypothetical protein